MAIEIIAYDIEGSSFSCFAGHAQDYRKSRAVRRFLVDGNDITSKAAVLYDTIKAVQSDSSLLHPQDSGTDGVIGSSSKLPLQEGTITKYGRSTYTDTAHTWLVELVYYYPL